VVNFIKTVVLIGTVVIFISFVLALCIRKNKNIPGYLRNFYLYPFIELLLSFLTVALILDLHKFQHGYANGIEKIFSVIDFLFWAYFFLELFRNSTFKKTVKIILVVFIFFIIPVVLVFSLHSLNYDIVGYTNIGKCILCIVYFFSLFTGLPNVNLKKDPTFWILSGVLFNTTISTPIFLSIGYFRSNNIFYMNNMLAIGNISIIIMHLLFIKGYLCIIQQRRAL